MMRKGVAGGIILMVLILLGSYQLYYTAMVGMSGVRVGVRRYQEDMYALQNSLEAGREYMKTSLRYSAYQACYDSLGGSGWPDISEAPAGERKVIDGKPYATLPSEAVFKAGLEKNTLKNINTYASSDYGFMGTYTVDLPAYESVVIGKTGENVLSFTASSPDKLEITRYVEKLKIGGSFLGLTDRAPEENIEETIILRKNSGLEETVETPCYELYLQAAQKSIELEKAIGEVLAGEIDRLKAGVKKADGDTTAECNSVLADAEKNIEESLNINGAEFVDATLTFAQIDYDGQNNVCTLREGTATATLKASVEGPADQTFPVWNGEKLAFEPLKLDFIVKGEYSSTSAI